MEKTKFGYKQVLLICIFLLFASLVLVIIEYSSSYGLLYNTDRAILDFIHNNISGSASDFFFSHITALANGGIFWISFGVILTIIPKTRKIGITVLLAITLGYLCGNIIIKNVVCRLRPYQMDETVKLIIKAPSDTSFPSGHTLVSFSSAIAVFLNRKKFGVCMLVIASTIAFSRLYLFVHFPTDILGAILLAILMANLSMFITNKIYSSFKKPADSPQKAESSDSPQEAESAEKE